jgi:hypothetical protein
MMEEICPEWLLVLWILLVGYPNDPKAMQACFQDVNKCEYVVLEKFRDPAKCIAKQDNKRIFCMENFTCAGAHHKEKP